VGERLTRNEQVGGSSPLVGSYLQNILAAFTPRYIGRPLLGSSPSVSDLESYRRWQVSWRCDSQGITRRGGEVEGFMDRTATGYDHGYDGEVFYLGLALDPAYIEGWVEGCLERIGEDNADEEQVFRDLWEDETQRDVVVESLKADCEVRAGRPAV
jgi:hypothetical protein